MPGEDVGERTPGKEPRGGASQKVCAGKCMPGKEPRRVRPKESVQEVYAGESPPGDMKELSGRKKCKRLNAVRSEPCAPEKGHGA